MELSTHTQQHIIRLWEPFVDKNAFFAHYDKTLELLSNEVFGEENKNNNDPMEANAVYHTFRTLGLVVPLSFLPYHRIPMVKNISVQAQVLFAKIILTWPDKESAIAEYRYGKLPKKYLDAFDESSKALQNMAYSPNIREQVAKLTIDPLLPNARFEIIDGQLSVNFITQRNK